MSKYPQSCFIVGKFVGVHPERQVSTDFQTRDFAIDVETDFNNIIVFQATRTALKDSIADLASLQPGDLVKVQFNVVSRKTGEGKWFTNVTAWKIGKWVAQDASDFSKPEAPEIPEHNPSVAAPAPEVGDDLPF